MMMMTRRMTRMPATNRLVTQTHIHEVIYEQCGMGFS